MKRTRASTSASIGACKVERAIFEVKQETKTEIKAATMMVNGAAVLPS